MVSENEFPFGTERLASCKFAGPCAFVCLLAFALTGGVAFGSGKSKLSQKPIPLQTEAYALLAVEDVLDYPGLVQKLRGGSGDPKTPAGRIWQLLSPRLRKELESLAGDAEISEPLQYRLINGLNTVLRRNDFYMPGPWSTVELPEELVSGLTTGLSDLDPIEVAANNRRLMQLSFPNEIGESQVRSFPKRPRTLRIFGDDFLNTGNLQRGFKIPTGAVWQPSLFAFGTLRSAWQYVETGDRPAAPPGQSPEIVVNEWANRLDLFFNLALTPTERILVRYLPIDQGGDFSGYVDQGPSAFEDNGVDFEGDLRLETLFFEGDFGEIFPKLDRSDRHPLDFGFSIGRQPIFLQEGILLNDNLDAIGITRNNILPFRGSNLRITALWAWANVNRGLGPLNSRLDSSNLIVIFSSIDLPQSTVDFDVSYLIDGERVSVLPDSTLQFEGGDQVNAGLSVVRRFGHFNTAMRINQSNRTGGRDTIHASDGTLIFFEGSWTPPYSHDIVYATFFWANGDFRSASRDPSAGGPLARAGILFEATGIGTTPAPIENTADESVGGAIGYQKFFDETRKQIIFEVGGRTDTDGSNRSRLGVMLRYQQAIGNRYIWRVDAFYVKREQLTLGSAVLVSDRHGLRTEFTVQF